MPTIGLWMYRNQGGDVVQASLKERLEARGCDVINDFDMRKCYVERGNVFTADGRNLSTIDVFYHMNADEQTPYQNEILRALDFSGTAVVNSWQSFSLAKDKFAANMLLSKANVNVPASYFTHPDMRRGDISRLFRECGSVVVKPRRNHGGRGIMKFDRPDYFADFIQATGADCGEYYLEKYVPFGAHDYRVELFNGDVIGGYCRECQASTFKTNVSSGGKMLDLMPSNEFVEVAQRAASSLGITATIVDMIRSVEDDKIYVLEVNPIMGIFVEQACIAEKKSFFDKDAGYCNDELKLSLLTDFLTKHAFLHEKEMRPAGVPNASQRLGPQSPDWK